MSKYRRNIEKIRDREKKKVAENYLSHARRFYDSGYKRDAYLFAEIGLKLDPENKGLKGLMSKL